MKKWFDQHRRHRGAKLAWGLTTLVWLIGAVLPSWAASSAEVGIQCHILNPPNAITDLQAAPVGSQAGDIQLTWTAPSNENGATIQGYIIRFGTYPASSPPLANTWWNQISSQIVIDTAYAPTVQEFTTISSLSLGVTYYFGIRSQDVDQQISPIDTRVGQSNQAQSLPLVLGSPPATPTNFAGTALGTSSIQWNWDSIPTAGSYNLYDFPWDNFVNQTTHTFLTETELSPNQALSRTLRASNGFGLSDPTPAFTIYTLAAVPTNLIIENVAFNSVRMSWSPNGNPADTSYRVERSLDGASYFSLTTLTTTTYTDTGLADLTTYYYRIRAVNGDGVATSPSLSASTTTLEQIDLLPPKEPMGLKGYLDPTGTAFTLIWEAVLYNADGSPINDLAGYNIYRSTSLSGPPTKLNPVPSAIIAFADSVGNQIYYYRVKAADTSGNESAPSLFADSSTDENVIYVATDAVTEVVMPSVVNDLLRSQHNKYGVPLTLSYQELPVPSNTTIVRNIRLDLLRGDNNQIVSDLAFDQPQSIVRIGYNVLNGTVLTGAPNTSAAAPSIQAATPDQLSIYWNNGITWIKVGGRVDLDRQFVETKSSYLGNFQLRLVSKSDTLNLDSTNIFPRLFTPNGDGLNDRVYFVLENPNDVSVMGAIFDMKGRRVVTLPSIAPTGIGTTLIWDGKDSSGAVVPSGAYIYKIEGEGKTFTGTVGVAR